MSITLNSLYEKRTKAQNEFRDLYESFPRDEKGQPKTTDDQLTKLQKIHEDLGALSKSISSLEGAESFIQGFTGEPDAKTLRAAQDAGRDAGAKDMASQLLAAAGYKGQGGTRLAQAKGDKVVHSFEAADPLGWLSGLHAKTLMTTSAGFAPQAIRDGTVVQLASRPPQLLDYIRIVPTTQASIKFMRQSTRTNNAGAVAEGAAVGESVLVYTEATADIRFIGQQIPVTDVQLEDVESIQDLINIDMALMVRQELDRQIVAADGTSNTINGLVNQAGLTQAKGSDTNIDAIGKAMQKLQSTGYVDPKAIVLHNTDWWLLALAKDSQNRYLLGEPGNAPRPQLWGLPVLRSEALTAGTGLVVDFDFISLHMRRDVTVETGWVGSQFNEYEQTIRASVRAGLKVGRTNSICTVTSIA